MDKVMQYAKYEREDNIYLTFSLLGLGSARCSSLHQIVQFFYYVQLPSSQGASPPGPGIVRVSFCPYI